MTGSTSSREMVRGKGMKTREEIVARALHIAALDGLGALSIGGLAKELKMSKSGLFAHFGSKETLEMAVVERASSLFVDHILVPIEQDGLEGIERVWTLCDSWLCFVEKSVLPGGYFFTGAFFQYAEQSGSIAKRVKKIARDWLAALRDALDQARSQEEVRTDIDIKQTAFELNGILLGALWAQLLSQGDYASVRMAILAKISSLATDGIPASALESVSAWETYFKERHQ